MSKYLCKKEWVVNLYEYRMEITPSLIKEVEDWLNENYKFEGIEEVHLTEENITDAFDRFWSDSILDAKPTHREGNILEDVYYCLGDLIADYLSDELWNADVHILDTETSDWEDYVVHKE